MLPPPNQAVQFYRSLDFTVVPLLARQKKPYLKNWQTMPADELAGHFKAGDNVGLRLDGLADVDLDHQVARQVVPQFLPKTGMTSGRASARNSHHWYVAEGVTGRIFTDITGEVLLEIRTAPRQTMVWPSEHTSGETVEWESERLEPAVVEGRVLSAGVGTGAAATLLVIHWPQRGRHDLSLALAGALLRNGWDVERVVGFIDAITAHAGDEEPGDRERAIRDTETALRLGRHATGLPTVARILGTEVTGRLVDWLDLRRVEEDAPAEEDEPANPIPFIMAFAEFIRHPFPEPEWLVEGFIQAMQVNMTVGPPKSLKTWLELYMHLCIASGTALFGKYAVGPARPTFYVQDDQGVASFQQRVIRLARGMGIPTGDLDSNFMVIPNQRLRFMEEAGMARLRRAIEQYRPALISFDTFRAAHAVDENDSTLMQPIMDQIKDLRDRYDVTVSPVHHTTKNAHAADVGTLVRGSGAIWGAADNLIAVQKEVVNEVKFGLVTFDGRGHDWAAPFKFRVEDTPEGDARLVDSAADRKELSEARESDARTSQWRDYLIGKDDWVDVDTAAYDMAVSANTARKWLTHLVRQSLAGEWKDEKDHNRVRYSVPKNRPTF